MGRAVFARDERGKTHTLIQRSDQYRLSRHAPDCLIPFRDTRQVRREWFPRNGLGDELACPQRPSVQRRKSVRLKMLRFLESSKAACYSLIVATRKSRQPERCSVGI